MSDELSLDDKLQAFVGQASGPATKGRHPVNEPMITHWVEAMGDHNPVYVDDEAARDAGFPGVIAPPTMLQAWIMRGLRTSLLADAARDAGTATADSPNDQVMVLLDEAGFTSVVATNCDQHYERPLVPGDHLEVTSVIDAISGEKRTGLGVGHFITNRLEYRDQSGELVATMLFRILKFKPGTGAVKPAATTEPAAQEAPARPLRPRPAITQDNSFFFEGAKQHRLLIQKCSACGTLRHPPRPSCANCRSFDWEPLEASGRGTIYSFVVNHYPQVPAFDYPLVVALVELEEGTRLIANVSGITPETAAIGTAVEVAFEDFDDELSLPVFHPADETRTN
ncbi:MAG TPA: bifunctional MaoC family dehydratase N-terminal/OB-fold nucleic acid binding domain-containing protein [Acidimicrobiales bacterium]